MRLWSTISGCLLVLVACAGGEYSTTTGFGGLSSPGGSMPVETGESGGTATAGVTDPGDGGTSSVDPSGSSGVVDETTGPTVPNPDGLPDGSGCTSDAECMTERCYIDPLPGIATPPGVCSVCNLDTDCVDAGLGTACTLDPMTLGGRCTYGALGSFCQTQAACQSDLFCASLVPNAPSALPSVCSACREDSDCNTLRCVPDVDLVKHTAQKTCKNTGTISDGDLCPLNSGDNMCVSGRCAPLDLGGGAIVGVCGPCNAMGGCLMGQVCEPPKFMNAFIAAKCV